MEPQIIQRSDLGVTLPSLLLGELSRGRVVPFVGAGISRRAGLPDWPQLLTLLSAIAVERGMPPALGKQVTDAAAEGQYELASDTLAHSLGDQLGNVLAGILAPPGLEPPSAITLLATASWPAIITTNFDRLLATAFGARTRLVTWQDAVGIEEVLRSHSPHIMFAHGLLEHPDSLVLTPEQYRRCLRHAAYRTYLKSIFTNYTVLFLGFSFSDRDVQELLEDLRETFGTSKTPHFALVATDETPDLRIHYLRSNFNIEAVVYRPSSADHLEFEKVLGDIIDHCPATKAKPGVLDAIKAKQAELDAAGYLHEYAGTCKQLSDSGYARSAWTSLQSELDRMKSKLALEDRIALSMLLARLQIADGQYQSACDVLSELGRMLPDDRVDRSLLREFAMLWFHAGFQNYGADVLDAASALAAAAGCDPPQLDELGTYKTLFAFLHGNPDIITQRRP
jgi:hypothetical protein